MNQTMPLSLLFPATAPAPQISSPISEEVKAELRTATKAAKEAATAGDQARYQAILNTTRVWVTESCAGKNLDWGWFELADAQVRVNDIAGAKATAARIKNPDIQARIRLQIAHTTHDRASLEEAARASLKSKTLHQTIENARTAARDQFRSGYSEDAVRTLRAAVQRFKAKLPGREAEEARRHELRWLARDQADYRDFTGATLTGVLIYDGEALARTATDRYKAGDKAGANATLQQALKVAHASGAEPKAYYLRKIAEAYLECENIPLAKATARTIPDIPSFPALHRDPALLAVVYGQAARGDYAGAKQTALLLLNFERYALASIAIAAYQKGRGNTAAGLKTLTDARQRFLDPKYTGEVPGEHDKITGLNRLAFLLHIWGEQAECVRTLDASLRVARRLPDISTALPKLKDIVLMQAMCQEKAAAKALAESLPPHQKREALERLQKADTFRHNERSHLINSGIDPLNSPRP